MFGWFLRRLGFSSQGGSAEVEYDPIYGLSRRALAEWLKWNPELAAEHQRLERAAKKRREKTATSSAGGARVVVCPIDDRSLKRIHRAPANEICGCSRGDFNPKPVAEDSRLDDRMPIL